MDGCVGALSGKAFLHPVLVLSPLVQSPYRYEHIIYVESHRSVQVLYGEGIGAGGPSQYPDHPHQIFLPYFQDDVEDPGIEGELLNQRDDIHRCSASK